ncbi:MAG: hypothetical protein WDO68_23405 [Gammaproteobacteria bacterium]
MTVATLLAIAVSGALLILLGARDPKRLRNSRHATDETASVSPFPSAVRHACGWLALAPGITLAVAGEWWAFLIWLGASTALGWAVAIMAGYSTLSVSHRNPQ